MISKYSRHYSKNSAIFYFRDLARKLDNGNMEVLIAEHYLQRMEWGRALTELNTSLIKGKVTDPLKVERLVAEVKCLLHG